MSLESATLGATQDIEEVEDLARLIAMAAVGIEVAVGPGSARGIARLAARELYKELGPGGDLLDAVKWLNENTVFRVDTYRVGGLVRSDERGKAFYLIGRECPIRQVLYLEDLPYGGLLCSIMCGFLEQLFSEKLGGRYSVSLERPGPNACLIRVGILSGKEPPESFEVLSPKPSREEYTRLLRSMFFAILRALSRALYTTLGKNVAMSYRAGKEYGRLVGSRILAEGYEPASVLEAVSLLNSSLRGFIQVSLEGENIRIVGSRVFNLIEKAGVEHPEYILYIIRGFLAGVLEALLGRRVDLRSTSDPYKYSLFMR